jgi:hypothetical protein
MVTVSDAATLTPRIMDTLRAVGIEVTGMAEHQPTFDEVFTGLVERRRAERGMNDADTSEDRGPVDG